MTTMPTNAPAPGATPVGPPKGLSTALWIAQALLAFAFGMAGFLKLTTPIDELVKSMAWVGAVPAGLVRVIATCELAGAIGVVLPALTRLQPRLMAAAALGFVVLMTLAAVFHASRGELSAIGVNAVLGGLALFVAWGRGKKLPIAPKA